MPLGQGITVHLATAQFRKKEMERKSKESVPVGANAANLTNMMEQKEYKLVFKASSLLPQLNPVEEEFFHFIEENQANEVYNLVRKQPNFNVNCRNQKGHTGLTMAVKLEALEVVDLLLSVEGVELGDALLQAVCTGATAIISLILDRMTAMGYDMSDEKYVESSDFSPDVTPIMLAAQLNNFTIVRLLLERNHIIHKPHKPGCTCEGCFTEDCHNSLLTCKRRLNAYCALSSAVYICQTSLDPILTAMELSQELEVTADMEREFSAEYLDLAEKCSQLAVDLLDHCRTTYEVQLVLRQQSTKTENEQSEEEIIGEQDHLARLSLAIGYNQKKFVAHPNCQILLRSLWLGAWQDWRQLRLTAKVWRLVPRIIGLPIVALVYWFCPKTKLSQAWQSPINKFISFLASYIIFLMAIGLQNDMHTDERDLRGPPRTGVEYIILTYICGLIWRDIEQIWAVGLSRFLSSKWSQYNIVMHLLFLTTFFCWFLAYLDVTRDGNEWLPRKFWYQYDPTLIGEAIYSIAIIFAFGRLLFFLQVGQALGPLLVTLSRMFKDIFFFLVLFVTVMVSFSMGIQKIYHFYKDQVRDVNGVTTKQETAYLTFGSTFKFLYWALYGYTPPNYGDIVVSEHVEKVDNDTVIYINKHKFTESVGFFLLAVYNVVAIIILINMFIAMMSNCFMAVHEHADMEYKFARTKVWLPFFMSGDPLPPPFNLVPNPACLLNGLSWIVTKIGKTKINCCGSYRTLKQYDDKVEYRRLIELLILRYLSQRMGYDAGKFSTSQSDSRIVKNIPSSSSHSQSSKPVSRYSSHNTIV